MTLLSKIVKRRPGDLLLAVEALVLLAFFRVCLAVVPVRRILRTMTHGSAGSTEAKSSANDAGAEAGVAIARRVRWAVSAAARHSAIEFVCFPQALAGYTMLRWRGVAGTVVYGVKRSAEGELLAHTWLTVGNRTVLGGEVASDFTPVERWS
jgi:hypothetical protein